MKHHFTKMQGCGNDYVYINGFTEHVPQEQKSELAIRLSDRHFGVGSDGVIFINPSSLADFEMEMYNADGSRAEMCGNGMRCVAKYVYDHAMVTRTSFTIESFGSVRSVSLTVENGLASRISIDMGAPILTAAEIPVSTAYLTSDPDGRIIRQPVTVGDAVLPVTCVSMGNPHAVIFTDPDDVLRYGPALECHPAFPRRVNAEFVRIDDRSNVHMRVYERGTGETLACGTGCCATAVACILCGLTDDTVNVHLLGGILQVTWDRAENRITLTGPAVEVFTGETDF